MKPRLITFDCANTLLKTRWDYGRHGLACAEAVGLEFPNPDHAYDVYWSLLRRSWHEYVALHQQATDEELDAWWAGHTARFLQAMELDPAWAARLLEASHELIYGPGATSFTLFEDVKPTLERLRSNGCIVTVISNWDYSLVRILNHFELTPLFDHITASLRFGVEKPHASIFHDTLDRFSVEPSQAVHVGDDPVDDLQGALAVGMRAYLVDRTRTSSEGAMLATLLDLPEKLGCAV